MRLMRRINDNENDCIIMMIKIIIIIKMRMKILILDLFKVFSKEISENFQYEVQQKLPEHKTCNFYL